MSTNYPPGVSGNEPEIIGYVLLPCDCGEEFASWESYYAHRETCRADDEYFDGSLDGRADGQLSLIGPNDARVNGEQMTLW